MLEAVFILIAIPSSLAHSLLFCINFDGSSPCDPSAAPYHPSYTNQLGLFQHHTAGKLCQAGTPGGTDWMFTSTATAPTKVNAGDTVSVVWACNNHCVQEDAASAEPAQAFVYHSPLLDPDDSLLETTPLIEFDFSSCQKNNGINFNMLDSGSDASYYCTGKITIPTDWEDGVHTLVWGWKFLYQLVSPPPIPIWDADTKDASVKGTHLSYTTCFQYQVSNPQGGTVKATDTLGPQTFSADLVAHSGADPKLIAAGANGISYSAPGAAGTAQSPPPTSQAPSPPPPPVSSSAGSSLAQPVPTNNSTQAPAPASISTPAQSTLSDDLDTSISQTIPSATAFDDTGASLSQSGLLPAASASSAAVLQQLSNVTDATVGKRCKKQQIKRRLRMLRYLRRK